MTIVVPANWDFAACGKSLSHVSYTSRGGVPNADIRIGTNHPVFGKFPWTQQSLGCGQPGDFISVGYQYMLGANETENIIFNKAGDKSKSGWKNEVDSYNHNHNPNGYENHLSSNKKDHGSPDFTSFPIGKPHVPVGWNYTVKDNNSCIRATSCVSSICHSSLYANYYLCSLLVAVYDIVVCS